jgi:superfamily II DNA or RNA helicase
LIPVKVDGCAWLPKESVTSLDRIKKSLTVYPKDMGYGVGDPIRLYVDRNDVIGIPRAYFLKNKGVKHSIQDNTAKCPVGRQIGFNGVLRREQENAVKSISVLFQDPNFYGGIISLSCGSGKSILMLYLISMLKLKTLIVVHKDFLVKQWAEYIKTFLPDARVGIVQQSVCDYVGKDIVIGMVHSLSGRRYESGLYSSFGMLVVDEVHRISAPTWANVPQKFSAKYFVGLSATVRRKDGTEKVFFYTIGDIIYRDDQTNVNPLVKIYPYGEKNYYKGYSLSTMKSAIGRNTRRNVFIVSLVRKAYDAGREILIMSERVEHLRILYKMLGQQNISSDFYIGGRKDYELDAAKKNRVMLGTAQLIREGFDKKKLDTLFMVTPLSDVEQSIGRILRVCEEKKSPIVVDIVDYNPICIAMYKKRRKYYAKRNWQIQAIAVRRKP